MLVDIHICCNNPDNGLFTGRLEAMDVGGLRLEHKCGMGNAAKEPQIFISGQLFKISDLNVPITNHCTWVGNWCWDLIEVDEKEALKLLNHRIVRNNFSVLEAETGIYDKYIAGEPFTIDDLKTILED